uniref:Uncharacterized protein n=1 Tax=Piliocolobus tephrosceles TaxID=591936 RepID=A0A8C9LZF4_9PRIM
MSSTARFMGCPDHSEGCFNYYLSGPKVVLDSPIFYAWGSLIYYFIYFIFPFQKVLSANYHGNLARNVCLIVRIVTSKPATDQMVLTGTSIRDSVIPKISKKKKKMSVFLSEYLLDLG